MANSTQYRLFIIVPAIALGAMVGWSALSFLGTETDRLPLAVVIAALALVFVCALGWVTRKQAELFREDLEALGADLPRQAMALKHIGELPLKTLVTATGWSFLFLGCVSGAGVVLGFPAHLTVPFLVFCLSLGLFSSSFSYVLSDKLVSQHLFSHRVTNFPRDLREKRQQIKIFVVPAFILVMALLFASSLAILLLSGQTEGLTPDRLGLAGMGLVGFFIATVFLITNSNKSTVLVLKTVVAQLEQLSSGHKDLTQRIHIGSIDELGSIGGMVNDFSQTLHLSVEELKLAQVSLGSTGEELNVHAKSSAQAVQGILEDLEAVRDKAQVQRDSISESTGALEQITKAIESLDGLIGSQAASITQASSAVEEMVGNVSTMTTSIDRMSAEFQGLSMTADQGQATLAVSSERIRQISSRSQALMEANKVISTIASQTNLLAMNAAIEAAHAGDAGRGFSVVADEIRKLAETSAKNSQMIRTELALVQKAIEEVVKTSHASEQAFSSVSQKIKDTDHLVQEIHQGMKEQGEGSGQILQALQVMNQISASVRAGSSEMRAGSNKILNEMGQVHHSSVEIGDRLGSMTRGSGAISTSASRVASLANGTEETIRKMDRALATFTTAGRQTGGVQVPRTSSAAS